MFRRCAAIASLVLLVACSSRPAAADFTLVSDSGSAWRLSGRHATVLLSFGYAHCADTCPALLARLSRLAATTRARGQTVDIAMITVDPQRDRPPQLHTFVSRFPGTIGLTGTQAQIDTVETRILRGTTLAKEQWQLRTLYLITWMPRSLSTF